MSLMSLQIILTLVSTYCPHPKAARNLEDCSTCTEFGFAQQQILDQDLFANLGALYGMGYQAISTGLKPSSHNTAFVPLFAANLRSLVAKSGRPTSMRQDKEVPDTRRQRRLKQARVLSCKAYSFDILDDDQPGDDYHAESFLQQQPPASEVNDEPRGDGNSLTSFLPELESEWLGTIADGELLSSHPYMTNFSFLDPVTSEHPLDISTAQKHIAPEQPDNDNMTPPKTQSRARRVKYKESPTALASTPTTTPSTAPTQPDQPQPHMSPLTTLSHAATHRDTDDTSARMSERITTPLEVTPEAVEAATSLVPYSSSSAASDEHPKPSADSAIAMGGRRRDRRRNAQPAPAADDDHELVLRGRRSVGPTNAATNDSWTWDPKLGALVSNTSGGSYRPALASKSSNQRVTSKNAKSDAPSTAFSGKLKDSTWAKEPAAKSTEQRNDWANTDQDNGWPTTDQHNSWPTAYQQNDWAAANQQKSAPANGSWDTGHPPYHYQARANSGSQQNTRDQTRAPTRPFNHNGRVRIAPKARKPRESPWIKDSLIPKGDPNRHKTRWSSSSRESSSFDSNRASSGWGTRRKRGQNDDGADLADWAGGLGPASIDWDSRSQFRDHQSVAKIETWLDQTLAVLEHVVEVKLMDGQKASVDVGAPLGKPEVVEGKQNDLAPRYWFRTELDGKSAKSFWLGHIDIRDRGVKPVDKDDLKDAKPWWDSYHDKEHNMLKALVHPKVAGPDPEETPEERLARKHDEGAANAGEARKALEKAKRHALRRRTLAKRERAHRFSGMHNLNQASSSPSSIKPGLNIFLRSATKEDMVSLRDIYNRYINNAFVAPETDRLTETDMLERLQAIKDAKLPFIVACQRGEVIRARNKRVNGGEDMIMPDKVVGFACAADWSDGKCIYRPTVNLEVFVHMEQYMKHIGSCLADKMMGLLDPRFVERGGYDTVGEGLEQVEPARAVSNVLVRYSYEAENKDKLLWVSKWLKDHFGFKQVADLQGVAHKFDKE